MKFPKNKPSRSKKLMSSARGQACVRCNRQDGTVVSCHYSGRRQHSFGKGMSQKCDDMATAWLCGECHKYFDGYYGFIKNSPRHMMEENLLNIPNSEEFLYCIVKTNIERFKQGILKV